MVIETADLSHKQCGNCDQVKPLTAYGNQCACCGEAHYEFLTIDHIDGGGRAHRKAVHGKVYAELRRLGFPPGYQILCWNCNCSRGQYGYCPHHADREVAA